MIYRTGFEREKQKQRERYRERDNKEKLPEGDEFNAF
jgi:hypothetical protein